MDMASLPEDDFLPKLSQWCHSPRNSFARKDQHEETFSTTCPPPYPLPHGPHPFSRPTFALSLLFPADVSVQAHLLPFMPFTRLSSKLVLELLSLSLHAQTVAPDADHNSVCLLCYLTQPFLCNKEN